MIIYKITNLINGKCYVGQTIQNFKKYKNDHIKNALNKKDIKHGYEKPFYDALRKYGCDVFQWEILKDNITDLLMLNLMETFMIMVHGSHYTEGGYNLTWGGEGGDTFTNNPHKEETRRKLSKMNKGKIVSEETRRKISESKLGEKHPLYGKHHTEETKRKMCNSHYGEKNHFYGKHHTEETKRKMSKNLCKKKYIIMCPDLNIIEIINLNQFCLQNNLNGGHMFRVANKKLLSHKGYKILKVESLK